jgi:hypothetical protein
VEGHLDERRVIVTRGPRTINSQHPLCGGSGPEDVNEMGRQRIQMQYRPPWQGRRASTAPSSDSLAIAPQQSHSLLWFRPRGQTRVTAMGLAEADADVALFDLGASRD